MVTSRACGRRANRRTFLAGIGVAAAALVIVAAGCAPPPAPPTTTTTVPGAPTVTGITAGGTHSCARLSDGTARCWGVNQFGQLGNNTTTYSTVPVTVVDPTNTARALTGIASITAGGSHTCAVMTDGTARCWGVNYDGQLGNNTTTSSPVPVTVVDPTNTARALPGIASITAGGSHTCAVMTNGTARCWGYNDVGQLGNNTTTDSTVPVTVVDPGGTLSLLGVVTVSAGRNGTCALMTDTTARCWGQGNSTATGSLAPVAPVDPATGQALTGITNVDAGEYFGCAALADGTARCWNYNYYGQLGDNTDTSSTGVVTVVDPTNTTRALTGIASITAGGAHTCAVMTNGTARCWGANYAGQLGDNTTTSSPVPVTVVDPTNTTLALTGIASTTAGSTHTCAVMTNGTARCWGNNRYGFFGSGGGQLGDGTTTSSNVPVTVIGLG